MTHPYLQALTLAVLETAKRAGAFIRQELHQFSQSDIITKEPHSLVTYVDRKAEEIIVQGLRPLLEDAGFVTEENTVDQNRKSIYTWVIDPLDGTTNFIHRIPVFAVSIGLLEKGKPVLGVISHIMAEEHFYAWEGGGAWLNGNPIQVSKNRNIGESVIATGFPYRREHIEELVATLDKLIREARGIRRLGSAAIDLAYTACGRFDGYYEGSINAWDVAAGIVLVREAGGIVTGLHGEPEPTFLGHILACNPHLHPGLSNLVGRQ